MKIKEFEFAEFISEEEIKHKIQSLASEINAFYHDRIPVFLPVLNGSFMFAADLLRQITLPCKISFVKVSSYDGISSSGQLKTLIGLDESLFNQDVLVVEDIVDTGLTLQKIVSELKGLGAKSVEVASLLRKKVAREKEFPVRFVGFEIDREFVVGYGLDFDGVGRNHRQLFQLIRSKKAAERRAE